MKYTTCFACVAALHATSALQLVRVFSASFNSPVRLLRGPVMTETADNTVTGTSFLPTETIERAKEGNPIEKVKLEKDGTSAFRDVYEFGKAIRAGTLDWEDIEKADMDTRLKWVGLLHRSKRTPGRFMLRLRTPNGIVTSEQLRFYADSVEPYGPEIGVVDITTRQNIQLRGVSLEHADQIIDGLHERNQTSIQSALDNVRNMVGSPLAGIDPDELVDTRPFAHALNDWYTIDPGTGKRGNPKWGNLPRKFNIAVSGSRDDYAHTHINDIGLVPCKHGETGEVGFNIVLGGYMSIKRVAESVPMGMWIPAEVPTVIQLCDAILRIFRDEGSRKDRQKARLMWLVEQYGVPEFKTAVLDEMAKNGFDKGVAQEEQPQATEAFKRRALLGVHAQSDPSLRRVGVHIPVGRLSADECRQLADLADKYSAGEVRLTVEQNVILPNVAECEVDALLAEPALHGGRLAVFPGNIAGNTVSCTGAQFCGLALVETKMNADEVARKLDALVSVPKDLRIHWTGCPNSCGQVQIADIGIMGAPAKKWNEEAGKNKAVPGCNIFVGGRIGEDAHLALEPLKKGIPLDHDDLLPELVDIIVDHFGGERKVAV